MIAESISDRTLRRFTVDEYYAMMRAGILREEPGLELIDGLIVERPKMTRREASVRMRLLNRLLVLSDSGGQLRVNGPLRIDDMNETEPDLMVVRHRDDFYSERHPEPRDVMLLIEVSDSSLTYDLNTKRRYYASHAIRELWVVDAVRKIIHVYRDLRDGEYQDVAQKQGDETLAPLAFPDFVASVREMIG